MEWDGAGRLLTTGCLITESRNPGMTKAQVADRLREVAGANEVVWVEGGGLLGDDTDGHIDQLARFVDRETVVVATAAADDENHAGLEANYQILKRWGQQSTPRVEVHRLPIPQARYLHGQRVPESFCNYLRLGNTVYSFQHSDTRAPTTSQSACLVNWRDATRHTLKSSDSIAVNSLGDSERFTAQA